MHWAGVMAQLGYPRILLAAEATTQMRSPLKMSGTTEVRHADFALALQRAGGRGSSLQSYAPNSGICSEIRSEKAPIQGHTVVSIPSAFSRAAKRRC